MHDYVQRQSFDKVASCLSHYPGTSVLAGKSCKYAFDWAHGNKGAYVASMICPAYEGVANKPIK